MNYFKIEREREGNALPDGRHVIEAGEMKKSITTINQSFQLNW